MDNTNTVSNNVLGQSGNKDPFNFFWTAYRRLVEFSYKNRQKIFKSKNILLLPLLLSIVATGVLMNKLSKPIPFGQSKAAVGSAVISLLPANANLPPAKTFSLWVNTDQNIAFIRVAVNFDSSKLVLTTDPVLTKAGFNKISTTPLNEANLSGVLILVAGLDTSLVNAAPSGTFELATLTFNSKNTQNSTTNIGINTAGSQAVSVGASEITVNGNGATVILNTAVLPSPTAPVLTPRPTAIATVRPTPTASPVSLPTKTPSATQTANPVRTPIVAPILPPDPVTEIVQIEKASIIRFWKFIRLEVVATSSKSPNVTMEVVNYGKMRYINRINKYRGVYWSVNANPGLITVKSSGGGSASAFVTR